MSREIKFRAWRQDVVVTEPYGRNSFEQKFMENDIDDIKTIEFGSFQDEVFINAHRVDIMQYIGVKDKKEKEIYEKDIVLIDGEDEYFVVEWDNDTARFVMNSETLTVDFDNYWGYQVEVIGNVYENADLLKEVDRNE